MLPLAVTVNGMDSTCGDTAVTVRAALGVYNTTQSFGLFLGGTLGGVLVKHSGPTTLWLASAALALVWLGLGLTMDMPLPRVRQQTA